MAQRRRALNGLPFPQAKHVLGHWSAATLPSMADGTQLASWVASIGGAVAVQATSATQPTYKASGVGGRPGVFFNGSQRLVVTDPKQLLAIMNPMTSMTYASGFTIIVVSSNDATDSTHTPATVVGSGNSANIYLNASKGRAGNGTATAGQTIPYTGQGLTVQALVQEPFFPSGRNLVTVDESARVYINGTCVPRAQSSTTALKPAGAGPIVLGAGEDTVTHSFRGTIYDVIIMDAALTWPEIIQATKWAFDDHKVAYPWAGIPYFIVTMGDSVDSGTGTNIASEAYSYLMAANMSLTCGQWGNYATPSIKLNALEYNARKHIDGLQAALGGIPLMLVFHAYRNDGGGAAFVTSVNGFFANRKAINPRTKIVNITSTSYSGESTDRMAYCAAWDSDAKTYLDGYVAMHNTPFMGLNDTFTENPTYFSGDGIHPDALGNSEIETYTTPVVQAIYGGASGLQTISTSFVLLETGGFLLLDNGGAIIRE